MLAAGVDPADLADPNYVPVGAVLPDMEMFDAEFFGFSPREASIMDPQHRHFLECAWEALENAGHVPETFDGSIGVFGGSGHNAYMPYNLMTNPKLMASVGFFLLRHTGNDKDFLTTRVSYLLNLKGPSINVQTACSTSLVAIHLGVQSLLNRRVRHGARRRRDDRDAAPAWLPVPRERDPLARRPLPRVRCRVARARCSAAASAWWCCAAWPTRSPTATTSTR